MNRSISLFVCGFLALFSLPLLALPMQAFTPFTVNQVLFEGLQRIDQDNLDAHLVAKAGETFSHEDLSELIPTLYASGFFSDINVKRDGDNLVIQVQERKIISEISIEGNKAVKTEPILEAFETMDIKEGLFYDPLKFKSIERELQRLYASNSKYNASIDVEETQEKREQVAIKVIIDEGKSSKIQAISIIGNHAFSRKKLRNKMRLSTGGLFSFFTKDNEFSRQKLSADLEALSSYYMDRGYADFSIDSVQVSLDPITKNIFIAINLHEGSQYLTGTIDFQENEYFSQADFLTALNVSEGQVFSRQSIISSSEKMRQSLGNKGFLFARVNALPELERINKRVNIRFVMDVGEKVYVRKINFRGNTKTRDDVLRREMRQMEGALIDGDKVKRSRVRLQRLDYFKQVTVDTVPVEGQSDQVDLAFNVEEKSSGTFVGGLGYSQVQGLLLNASVQQKNFLGTGDTIGLTINNSQVNRVYSASYFDPYYTIDGISRGFQLFSRKTDAGSAGVADFASDNHGGSLTFGIPVSEYSTATLSLGFERKKIKETVNTPTEYSRYLNLNVPSRKFDLYRLKGGISYDSRNKTVFAEKGVLAGMSGELMLPGSGLQFYNLNLNGQWQETYLEPFTLVLKSNVSFGHGYGKTTELPFFERFYAGGPQTIRGFVSNSMGPKTAAGLPLGGTLKVVNNASVVFPPPFSENNHTVRLSLFMDMGNVYEVYDKFDFFSGLRYSSGVSVTWLSPLGPLSFSYASALNAKFSNNPKINDRVKAFQFSLGALF